MRREKKSSRAKAKAGLLLLFSFFKGFLVFGLFLSILKNKFKGVDKCDEKLMKFCEHFLFIF